MFINSLQRHTKKYQNENSAAKKIVQKFQFLFLKNEKYE